MNYKKRKNYRFLIYIFVFIIIIFILFYYFINDKEKDNILLNSLKEVSYKVLKMTSFSFINDTKSYNKDLINEINNDYINEIDNLKKILKLNTINSDKKYVNSTIIKRSNNYWYNLVTIDKGKKDNIKKGSAVINQDGLIGKVVKVYNNYSDIKLLTSLNKENYISVSFNYDNKNYYGLITDFDYIKNELIMNYVIGDFDKDKIKNINVTTSGLNDLFPSGLLIGKIKEIEKDKFNLSYKIRITPTVNFNNLNIVTIVLGDKK